MNNGVTGIERELVLSFLEKEGSTLTIQNQFGQHVIIEKEQFSIISKSLIFISQGNIAAEIVVGKIVSIGFFYKGRGFYFTAETKITKNGYAFLIPVVLFKQVDSQEKKRSQISASIYYTSKEKSGSNVQCCANEKFPLFQCFMWRSFSLKQIKESEKAFEKIANLIPVSIDNELAKLISAENKIFYVPDHSLPEKNYFPFPATITIDDVPFYERNKWKDFAKEFPHQVCIPFSETPTSPVHSFFSMNEESVALSPLDIEDTLQLLPVCHYLSMEHETSNAVQGRAMPFSILYLSESVMIIGQIENKMFLEKGSEYPVSLFIPMEVGQREVFLTMFVSRIYENKKGTSCAVCRYTSIKEEDRRFLFEKLYASRYR